MASGSELPPVGGWCWSSEYRQICQVIDTQSLWGQAYCRVWLPDRDAIVRVRHDRLEPVGAHGIQPAFISYVAAAARVADALTQDVLIAPIEASVIPLPHQLRALSQAVSSGRVRYLLADEVGLGKTIEAGLIIRELKLRGLVKRILVIVPRGLVNQWVAEMRTHFGEDFRLLIPSDFETYRHLIHEDNVWRNFDQVICPLDSVKPIESRRGWSEQRLSDYNRDRFEDLISAGWDMVVVDEAHRLGGSTEQVARYKLGQGLAEAAPYILLLSATPHQGKSDAFHRLMSLIDPQAFPDATSVTRERVQQYVIRTEKRKAIDAQGNPLFKPRRTELVPVVWDERARNQRLLYQATTEYVRHGYNQAILERKNYLGFLMILTQRLVTSSTRAIRTTLERRLEVLQPSSEQPSLFSMISEDDWSEMDGQEQIDALLSARISALRDERAEVKALLDLAKLTEASGPDVKAVALLDWIYRLQQEEGDPDLKVLVFTEFVPTQDMLREFLTARGFPVVILNGTMSLEEREKAQKEFAKSARILISTDAGGEGLNLQFCHVAINYDIPWNPMKLEQRIGRVDRIGQEHVVRALNFVLNDTIEFRVRQVLEEKLAVILEEFGVDKTSDVLDSSQSGQMFDDLYVEAILDPDSVDTKVDAVISEIHEQARVARETAAILGPSAELDASDAQMMITHPLPDWVEKMTTSYVLSQDGIAERNGRTWKITWPDGTVDENVVFTQRDAEASPAVRHLTLEDARVRGLALRIPRFAKGQPIPAVRMPALPGDVDGLWSLWQICLRTPDWNQVRVMPVFVHRDGRILLPTARSIWDQLLADGFQMTDGVAEDVIRQYEESESAAMRLGKSIYDELVQRHRSRLSHEREKGLHAYACRRNALARIGLPSVRDHRLAKLAQEETEWLRQLEKKSEASPDMFPLLILHVTGGASL